MPFDEMNFLIEVQTDYNNNYFFTDQDDDIVKDVKNQKRVDNKQTGDAFNKIMSAKSTSSNLQNEEQKIETKVDINEYVIQISPDNGTNHIQNTISQNYNRTSNPYTQLLRDFTKGKNGGQKSLRSTDFIYLRDIGVYPINRMMILRRFATTVPGYDLNPMSDDDKNNNNSPSSTVIGWVKPDDNLFNFSFNEVWKTESKWLHDLIREIINDQFGIDVANIFPIPGWGQGFLFGMMNNMGMTDYTSKTLPLGDANLLQEGVTRQSQGQSLMSNFSFTLDTCYELKYVDGVDPTAVFHNIMQNLLEMGTSNMNFLFKGGSSITGLMKFVDNPDVGGLITVVQGFVNRIIKNLKETITTYTSKINKKIKGITDKDAKVNDKLAEKNVDKNAVQTNKENYDNTVANMKSGSFIKVGNNKATEVSQTDIDNAKKRIADRKKSEELKGEKNSLAQQAAEKLDVWKNSINTLGATEKMLNFITDSINTVLASTIGRYKWPIRGAINQSTGMVVTPWHLTIGNPYSPVISMNNIKVDNVEITLGKEMMFNDLPKYINVSIKISQARNMGKQEILRMFGVTYKRQYSKNISTKGDGTMKTRDEINEQIKQSEIDIQSKKQKPKR